MVVSAFIKVHGDIRHLEKKELAKQLGISVHGDIRHLEIRLGLQLCRLLVHGDIRHLEKRWCAPNDK